MTFKELGFFFSWREENRRTRRKNSGAETTTNHKLSPHLALKTLYGGRNNLETKHLFQQTYMTERIIKLMFYINNHVYEND